MFGKAFSICLSLVLGCVLGNSVQAALIAYEPFDYTSGETLDGKNSGTGFSNAWNGTNTITSPGSTYTDVSSNVLNVAGNKFNSIGGNIGSFRTFTTVPTSGTFYVSFLAQTTSTTSGYMGLSLFNGASTETLFLGRTNTQTVWGIDPKTGTSAIDTGGPAITNLAFLVYRIDYGAGNATINLFVNPGLGTEPGTADATTTRTAALVWDRIRLQGNGATGSFDEIRFGTTYADVAPIPEPGTLALIGSLAGIFGLLGLKSRRRAA